MISFLSFQEPREVQALVAFIDLSHFAKSCQRLSDPEIADWMNEFYTRVLDRVEHFSGYVVKFIGDAALVVCEEQNAERGILGLLELKNEIDRWCESKGYKCRLEVKIHFGEMMAGPFGPRSSPRFDILGKAVNTAAMLEDRPFCLSPQAFRQLSPEQRRHFKKHTPPITYIRSEDRHT